MIDQQLRIPDRTIPIIAWKSLTKRANGGYCSPLFRTQEGPLWIRGQPRKAKCIIQLKLDTMRRSLGAQPVWHEVPQEGCTCGFYALKPPGWRLWRWVGITARGIPAKVELYGKVIEHERGYRAEYARLVGVHPEITWMVRTCWWWPAITISLVLHHWKTLGLNLVIMGLFVLVMSWLDRRQERGNS